MKKVANKILIAILAIVVLCIIVEVPLLSKHQKIRQQKLEEPMQEWQKQQQSLLEKDSVE